MINRFVLVTCAAFTLASGTVSPAADESDPSQEASVDYLRDIKPILQKRCVKCHGAEKQESGLRLDTAGGALTGGDSGLAIAKGKSNESLLIRAVTGADDAAKMPPEGPPLSDEQIALLRRWIDQGAKAPEEESAKLAGWDHWAFQRPVRPALPVIKYNGWARNAIDRFILARLERENIAPAPPAERSVLIRRLSLDLRGLPPSPEEVAEFLADDRPGAYERLVDRMFASPAYGERWGRHWLDLARYADSNGYTRDFGREIWKYREWVIAAINRDMSFEQFTIEQFAGDMLPGATLPQQVATGFHRNTLINEEGGTDQEQFRVDAVADRVNTTGVVFLGLTLGCARCHQHKYDPLPQREYYELFAFLNDCDEPSIEAPSQLQIAKGLLDQRAEIRGLIARKEKQLAAQADELAARQAEWEKTITPEERAKLPGPTQAALDVEVDKRDATQKKLVTNLYKKSAEAKKAFPLLLQIGELRETEPKIPTTMVLRARGQPRETFVHKRGDFLDHGVQVQPDVPDVLHPLPADSQDPTRLDLARWLVDPANPLTPRVIVNRFWQRLFGIGIVETENDFGLQGEPPTHPELLDWLAVEFVRQGWSMKAIQRLIVTSATYRQSSHFRPELAERDPRNRLLARQSRIRLEAEIIRDSALTAGGLLCRNIGGPSVHPPQPEGVFQFTQDPKPWKPEPGGDRYRRGMYTFFWRSSPYPALMVFDFPNSNVTCTRRVRSNTPLQALTLANDVTFVQCARSLAERVLAEERGQAQFAKSSEQNVPVSHSEGFAQRRVQLAFNLALARDPSVKEAELLEQIVKQQQEAFAAGEKVEENAELAAWTAACRVLINLDEFVTRE